MELQGLEAVVPSARKESCGRSEYFLRALVCVYSVCCALLVAGCVELVQIRASRSRLCRYSSVDSCIFIF